MIQLVKLLAVNWSKRLQVFEFRHRPVLYVFFLSLTGHYNSQGIVLHCRQRRFRILTHFSYSGVGRM